MELRKESPPCVSADLLEKVLAPFPGTSPAGPHHRADQAAGSGHFAAISAFDSAREISDDRDRVDKPDWRKAVDLSAMALAVHTKDLDLVQVFAKAATRAYGVRGLRDGLRVLSTFVETLWTSGLHPRATEDRVLILKTLLGEAGEGREHLPIRGISISEASAGTVRLWDILQPDAGAKQHAEFDRILQEGSPEHYESLLADLEGAQRESRRLRAAFEAHGVTGQIGCPLSLEPLTRNLSDLVAQARRAALMVLPPAQVPGLPDSDSSESPSPTQAARDSIPSRSEAIRLLGQLAAFFRDSEPHSPISYALEQTIRWGRLSLPELLSELVPDASTRKEINQRVGIVEKTPKSS